MTDSGIERYFSLIQDLQKQVMESQREVLQAVAVEMARTVEADGRIFIFGTGHSHMLAEEAFYRAGGLAAATPVFCSALMLHENALLSSQLERSPNMARLLLDRYEPHRGEMIFIYSNSGVNLLPVEMALLSRESGLKVVAVCARRYAEMAPLSSLGKRLYEVTDYAIDNGGLPGDALVEMEGSAWRVGPSSTIINTLIWNSLVSGVAFILGEKHMQMPIYASSNMPGADEHNKNLLEKWRKVNPHL